MTEKIIKISRSNDEIIIKTSDGEKYQYLFNKGKKNYGFTVFDSYGDIFGESASSYDKLLPILISNLKYNITNSKCIKQVINVADKYFKV